MYTYYRKVTKTVVMKAIYNGWNIECVKKDFFCEQLSNFLRKKYPYESRREGEKGWKARLDEFLSLANSSEPFKNDFKSGYNLIFNNFNLLLQVSEVYERREEIEITTIGLDLEYYLTSQILEALPEIDALWPKIQTKWDKLADTAYKENKKNEIGKSTIQALLKAKLKGTGLKYRISEATSYTSITFCLGDGKQYMSVDISKQDFMEQIPLAVDAAVCLNKLVEKTVNSVQVRVIGKYKFKWEDAEE